MAVPVQEAGYPLYRELAVLEPSGAGNPAPHVAILGAPVVRVRAAGRGHAQLTIAKGREVLDVIAFGRGDLVDAVREGDRLDIVGRLTSRTFGGLETLRVELLDAGPAGTWQAMAAADGWSEAPVSQPRAARPSGAPA